ncbi:hypothetical protein BFP70_14940 [Thioclava sp. SK-1]|uniref:alpha/beta fold hydrolase n=1 Tax=Thioclava sp. SK-1 TaxID=1889770 RepID=UPI0008267261|nr:alpha/beta hydrolase [Thioclava sp. SK-1]OCX61605.1 hypothetical protein BFP70_14940 [Thioclava sp. SK-1]
MIPITPMPAELPLHLSYVPGTGKRLVISFSGVGTERHSVPEIEFGRTAWMDEENHVLFVADESRSWMNHPGLAEMIVETIEDLAEHLDVTEICAIGNSMGGSAALILASQMAVDRVIVFSPQFSVHPDVIPEESRWMFFRKEIEDWLYPTMPDLTDSQTDVLMLHGGTDRERAHALRFPDTSRYRHFIFPDEDHNIAPMLHESDALGTIVHRALRGQMTRACSTIKAAGGVHRRTYETQRLNDFSEEA